MLFYKYLCPNRRCILNQRLIRFTPPGLFNDPFDSLPFVEYGTGEIEKLVNKVVDNEKARSISAGRPSPDDFWHHTKKKLIERYLADPSYLPTRHLNESLRPRMNSEVGILCVSFARHSILMWSHYSSGHTGFLLGLDGEDDFFKHRQDEPGDIGELRKVTYSRERVQVVFPVSETDPSPNIFFTKNEEWAYEQEWRILRFLKDADETPAENIHLFKIPPSAIREVIFGSFAPSDLIAELVSAKQNNPDLNHVRFYRAKLSHNRFEMDIAPYES